MGDIGARSKQRKVERQVGEVADAAAPSLSRFLLNQKLSPEIGAALLAGLVPVGEAVVLADVANPNVSPEEKAEELLAKAPCPQAVEEAGHDVAHRVALHAVVQTLMLVGPVVSEWRKVGFATTFELPKRLARRLSELDVQLEAFGFESVLTQPQQISGAFLRNVVLARDSGMLTFIPEAQGERKETRLAGAPLRHRRAAEAGRREIPPS